MLVSRKEGLSFLVLLFKKTRFCLFVSRKEGFVSRTRRAAEPLFFCFFCFKNRSKKTTNNGIVCLFQEGFVSKRSRRKNEIFCFKKKKKHQTRRQLTTNKVLFQRRNTMLVSRRAFLFCCSSREDQVLFKKPTNN